MKERVRVYRRGGVHQSSDNEVIVETDDEFHYNKKVRALLEKEEGEGMLLGATRSAIVKDYNMARKAVRKALLDSDDKAGLDATIEQLAVVYLRYRGTFGWAYANGGSGRNQRFVAIDSLEDCVGQRRNDVCTDDREL